MALVLKDRVKQTASAPGTGTITLLTTPTGFQSFAAVGNANTTYFAIVDSASGDWEVNYGTYTSSGTTLSRSASPLSSSAGGALVNFTGTVDVFVTYPSENAVWRDTSGTIVQSTFGAITATSAALTTGTVSTTPSANTDIANKSYVDGLVTQGISYHEPVYVESPNTAGNLNALYNQPGGAGNGVGATLTNNGTKAALTIDGILMTTTKRVLIYNQTNAFENGVYTVTTVGTPDPGGTNWVLTRSTDANTYGLRDPNALGYNDAFFVTNGNTGAGETYVCTTTGVITFGSTNITFAQISSAQVYSAGTGLTLTNTTFSITPTGTAGTYGSVSAVPVFVTNAQGQVTSVTNTNIAISGSAVSGNIAGSAGSVANSLTAGTYLTGTAFNGSAAQTWTVDATSANTASKVVARDASGNFSAGTITATLSGAATSATTATNLAGGAANQIAYQTGAGATTFTVAPSASNQVLSWNGSAYTWVAGTISGVALGSNLNSITAGTYLTGTAYNGSAAQTWTVNATSANTASTVVARDASGNFSAGTITAALSGNATTSSSTSGNAATATALQTARTIGGVSFNGTANIDLPGVNTSGNQNTSGNAATATALTSTQSSWTSTLGNVVGLLAWKNYGNSHVIFDASASTTPSGGGCSNTNSTAAWSATYPTLMGWNGSTTYGVRVDSARVSDSASAVTGVVAVANGGTGLSSTPSNGQLDIGNGSGFTRATLTAGTGISITNSSGAITIASSGGASLSVAQGYFFTSF